MAERGLKSSRRKQKKLEKNEKKRQFFLHGEGAHDNLEDIIVSNKLDLRISG
jgi:hypothetical protein